MSLCIITDNDILYLVFVFIFPHQVYPCLGLKMVNLIGNGHAKARNEFKRPWSMVVGAVS